MCNFVEFGVVLQAAAQTRQDFEALQSLAIVEMEQPDAHLD
jgi:hypothetical protein